MGTAQLVFAGDRVAQSLVFCAVFWRSLLVLLIIVFFVLRFGASDYPFDISQPFSQITTNIIRLSQSEFRNSSCMT